jgi:hypothetical protein
LVSKAEYVLKPIVEAALENEPGLIEEGIKQTEQHLKKFEVKYQLNTQDSISKYENDQFEEFMDFIEWIGEFKLLKRLIEKADTLMSISFEN